MFISLFFIQLLLAGFGNIGAKTFKLLVLISTRLPNIGVSKSLHLSLALVLGKLFASAFKHSTLVGRSIFIRCEADDYSSKKLQGPTSL